MKSLLIGAAFVISTMAQTADANEKTRVHFSDGTYVDVISDDKGTIVLDSEGNSSVSRGDNSQEVHEQTVREQESSYDHTHTQELSN